MLEIIFTVPICCFLFLMMRSKFGKWINYVNVFNAIWLIGIITTAIGSYQIYKPSTKVYVCIMLMMITFNAVTYFTVHSSEAKLYSISEIIKDYMPRRNKIDIIILLMLILLMMPELKNSLSTILIGGYNLVRGNALTSFTWTQWFLYHYGNSIIIGISVVSIIDLIFYGKGKLNFVLSIIATIINITIFASRWMLLEFVLVVATALLLKYHFKISKVIKENKKIVFGILMGVIMLLYITSQRKMSGGNSTIIENIYYYFWGSISCMSNHFANIDQYIKGNGYMLGQMYFSGIVGFIGDTLGTLFKISITPGIQILNKITQDYIAVSPTIRMNNNVTMLTAFYVDGGWGAIVLLSGLTAVIMAKLHNQMYRKCSVLSIAYFIFAYSLLLFGLIEWMPARSTNIWVFIVIYFIYWLRRKKIRLVK